MRQSRYAEGPQGQQRRPAIREGDGPSLFPVAGVALSATGRSGRIGYWAAMLSMDASARVTLRAVLVETLGMISKPTVLPDGKSLFK